MFPSSRKGHPAVFGVFGAVALGAVVSVSLAHTTADVAHAQPPPPDAPLGATVRGLPPVPRGGGGVSFPESIPPPPSPLPPGFFDNTGTAGFDMPSEAGGEFPTFPVVPFEGGGFGVPSGGSVFGKPQVPNLRMAFEQRTGNEGDCPTLLQLVESRGRNVGTGEAQVQWITDGGFSLRSRSTDKAVWEAPLDARYAKCDARARIGDVDGVRIARGAGEHLSMDFAKGIVRLTLDLSRAPYLGRIVEAAVEGNGRPQWRYVLTPSAQSRTSEGKASDGAAMR